MYNDLLKCKEELEKALIPIFKNQMLLQEFKKDLKVASDNLFECIDDMAKEKLDKNF
jgi:hypothetical protein